jgi:phospholipase/carboxylesterase
VYREVRGFQKVLERNQEALIEAEKNAHMVVDVDLPQDYEESKEYPLFLALHGGGENLEEFKPRWASERLEKEFIVAYVQSSQVATMTGFHWQDTVVTARELDLAYRQVTEKYPVDESRVLIGGFSSGGFASLVTSIRGDLPVCGFVVLCPEPPDFLTDEEIQGAKERGVRGTLLTTERDRRIERQRTLMDRMRDAGLQYQYWVTPDIGHWYPDDLGQRIDQAIAHIEAR